MWLVILGLVIGLWLGFNLARLYPTFEAPGLTIAPPVNQQIKTATGLVIKPTLTERRDDQLYIEYQLINQGITPLEPRSDDFYLTDDAGNRFDYDRWNSSMGIEHNPINPGISQNRYITFDIPPTKSGYDLNFEDISIMIGVY